MRAAALICSTMAHVDGCVDDVCSCCGTQVWIAPTGQQLRAEHNPDLLCMSCGAKELRANPEIEVASPTPQQLHEIAKQTRRPPI